MGQKSRRWKLHQLKKSTPLPVVTVVTNMSYGGWPSPLHHELLKRSCYSCPSSCNIQACCLYLSVNMMPEKNYLQRGEHNKARRVATSKANQHSASSASTSFSASSSNERTFFLRYQLWEYSHPIAAGPSTQFPFFPIEATLRARLGQLC